MLHVLNSDISIAGALCREDVTKLAQRGYKAIIDLRADEEPTCGGLKPVEEQSCVADQGLSYRNIPIGATTLDSCHIDHMNEAVRKAQGRVLIHCGSGRRACALALIHISSEKGSSIEECMAEARKHGFDWDTMPGLRDFFVRYLKGHGPRPRTTRRVTRRKTHAVS
jgi:uncharacterized protein (TIGR01244 family)